MRAGRYAVVDGVEYRAFFANSGDSVALYVPSDEPQPDGFVFNRLVEPKLSSHLDSLDALDAPDGKERLSTRLANKISGSVARVADVTGLDTSGLFRHLGLGYDRSLFTQDTSMFGIRFGSDDFQVPGAHAPTPDLPGIPNSPLDTIRDAQYLPSTDGTRRSLFDQITSNPDPGARANAWNDLAAGPYKHALATGASPDSLAGLKGARDAMAKAVDGDNLFRGDGFAGTGPDYAPEYEYSTLHDVPKGSELWQTRPDGSQRVVAVFGDRKWLAVTAAVKP